MKEYNPLEIEPRWQAAWEESGINKVQTGVPRSTSWKCSRIPRATFTWATPATIRLATLLLATIV